MIGLIGEGKQLVASLRGKGWAKEGGRREEGEVEVRRS